MNAILVLLLMAVQFSAKAELTWYDPSRCSTEPWNCFNPDQWWKMAAGHDARHWYNRAVACPQEFPLGTKFVIDVDSTRYGLPTDTWVCLDRGGAVDIKDDGVISLDLLVTYPIWRDTVDVQVVIPDGTNNRNQPITKDTYHGESEP